ncbi:hydantoinase/oxoprolinase family protein [Halorientalis pallida]|uniref:Hydantoinase/oxoprolinase family protein n=1 Tax=Halorientalis pallida TaxID=2479928 RepID=A0A498KVQ8_9EURY|nr:hydantoinase/oxoprolinase family protein [Halorientalis pallida]RXK49329.1 hydantoinase/oxoprolinase family protein [Halorientalis pallida]
MNRAGVDIGGTFTDVIVFDEESGEIEIAKTPSTPDNPAEGVINGLTKAETGIADLDFFSHGSTVGTNALIERELPRIGLITTEGFRDVHEIRDATKDNLWDAYEDVADPYVQRRDRLGVPERVDASGAVVEQLDEEATREVVRIFEKRGIDTIAVSLVNAYVNGEHEARIAEIVEEEHPDAFVCTSHEILPEMFEHERTSTTVINAALVPVVREYLTDLSDQLDDRGYHGDVLAMHSGGGVMTTEAIAYYAARIANSGPTAGAIASQYIAEQCGFGNAIGFDMGGTSADVSLTYDGDIEMTDEWAVEYGYPIMFPSTDIETIGAGGGSVAWIDDGGSLRVGPKSQGADPGPACYLRGGDKPTTTDANVVLGWVDPDKFLGGDMEATAEPAERVIERDIADPLGLDLTEAASSIEQIAVANMCNAVRLVSTSKGYDPRDFALVGFGGAGPLHAAHVAKQMSIPKVIIPPYPGINSALGCLLVDVEHDLSRTFIADATADVVDDIEGAFAEMESEIYERLDEEGVEDDDMRMDHELKMRYAGQWRSLDVPCARPIESMEAIREQFHDHHEQVYAYSDPDQQVEIYGLRVTGRGIVDKPSFPELDAGGATDAHVGTRDAYFDDAGEYVETDVYDRSKLGAGASFEGPAIVEQMDSTVVVPPGTDAEVERTGNLIITVK